MVGKGLLREQFQPWASSGNKTSQSGRVKRDHENVVLVDVDSDNVDDVIVIDAPESFCSSSVRRKDRGCPFPGVISIDDDESDDVDDPRTIVGSGGELDSDASTNKRCSPASDYKNTSKQLDDDDCFVVHERKPAFKFQKCRQTYSANASGRNRFGLGLESESGSSESDCSDCEILEGSFTKRSEQWEKASLKRKHHFFDSRSVFYKQTCPSGSHGGTNVEVVDRTEQHSSGASDDGHMDGTYFNHGMKSNCQESDQKVDNESFKNFKPGSVSETDSLDRNSNFRTCREDSCMDFGPKSYNNVGVAGYSRSNQEMGAKGYKVMSSNQKEAETIVGHDKDVSWNKGGELSCAACSCDASSDERHLNCYMGVSKCQTTCHSQVNSGEAPNKKVGPVPEESHFCNTQSPGESEVCDEKSCSQAKVKPDSLCDTLSNGKEYMQDKFFLVKGKLPSAVRDELHAQHGRVSASDERDIINEREKLKETNEYKRAIEEEWASRQRQLQIQAEEAQRLRKRRKAENMRLLNMQRRQQQRVDEVRETQKKDEEKMNLKEQLQIEIRKQLNNLEMTCTDMVSLLRGLGIPVGGGFKPLSQEVHAAYKQALLKFHPDRASKTDMRQQVEAEEKFKLISRMKEKFLSTSCYKSM